MQQDKHFAKNNAAYDCQRREREISRNATIAVAPNL
jgi:hypothetical protein